MPYRRLRSVSFAPPHRQANSRAERESWDRPGRVRTSNHPRKDPGLSGYAQLNAVAPKRVEDQRLCIQWRRMGSGPPVSSSKQQARPSRTRYSRRFLGAGRRAHRCPSHHRRCATANDASLGQTAVDLIDRELRAWRSSIPDAAREHDPRYVNGASVIDPSPNEGALHFGNGPVSTDKAPP